jgi:hypothetical protein
MSSAGILLFAKCHLAPNINDLTLDIPIPFIPICPNVILRIISFLRWAILINIIQRSITS